MPSETNQISPLWEAHNLMEQAFSKLNETTVNSRENSLAKTNLEQAMMWNNKDRSMKGELPKNPTHVE